MKKEDKMSEHNYERLHLDGTYKEKREMVHNLRPVKLGFSVVSAISGMVSAFITVAVGASVMAAVAQNLREQGLT